MRQTIFLLFLLAGSATAQTPSFFALGPGVNNRVYDILEGPSPNSLYAGGTFTTAGGSTANYFAMWDGSSWSAPGGGTNYYVWDMLNYNGTLHLGGGFNTVGGGTVAWGVASWDGSSWAALGGGIHGEVRALAEYNNELYAAGLFDTLSGFNAGRGIVKWNGTAWSSLGGAPGDGVAGPGGFFVDALQVFNGKLYAGGSFVTANGATMNNIAVWDGNTWSAIGSGTNGPVHAFHIYNNDLYVGGDFSTANGVPANNLAKLSGNTFVAVGSGTNGKIYGIGDYMNELYVTGVFTMAGSTNVNNISRWDGVQYKPCMNGLNFEGYCLTPIGNSLYVGGFYSVIGPVLTNNIAGWVITTGIGEKQGLDVSVYPNPGNGLLNLEWEGSELEVVAVNSGGQAVFRASLPQGIRKRQLDLSFLPPGIYLLHLRSSDAKARRKIVIGY